MKISSLSCFACTYMLLTAGAALSQEVAVTVDDLPSHGALPSGMTRSDIARSILKSLKDAHAPKVYGFVNAKKLELHPQHIEVLKPCPAPTFPPAHPPY